MATKTATKRRARANRITRNDRKLLAELSPEDAKQFKKLRRKEPTNANGERS